MSLSAGWITVGAMAALFLGLLLIPGGEVSGFAAASGRGGPWHSTTGRSTRAGTGSPAGRIG
jgi:hypothetical protein